MSALTVWMDGAPIATLTESRRRMALTYEPGVGPLGRPLISVAMPVSTSSYTDRIVRPFFHGLLPEGPARQIIAYDLGLAGDDDMGLLAALGRDCAGALMVLPEGAAPHPRPEAAERLDDDTVRDRIRALPVHPLGVTATTRASLPGVQPKLLLCFRGGQWFTPDEAHPTTHIVKPAIPELPGSVANEAFCLDLAARAGLKVAPTSVARFADTTVLVSERYDRRAGPDGSPVRIHQEDACQALSVMTRLPQHKYERYGGPKLRRIAETLTAWGGSALDLLGHVTFSVIVGNADQHGKNISFLHHDDGSVSLAPLYDVMCTTHYDGADGGRLVDTEVGMFIAGRTDILAVTADDLTSEARRWGIRAAAASTAIGDLACAVLAELDTTRDALGIDVPAAIVERIRDRARGLA